MVRKFRKLRLSLTDACNFACVYCVADSKAKPIGQQTQVNDFLRWVAAIHDVNPLNEVRLTGGEPTLYRNLIPLVSQLKAMGIAKISMTTNGFSLSRLANPLRLAGLSSVNVSLDALDENIFRMMGGKSPAGVLAGIDAALAAGLETKINTTLVAEMNDSQILPLLGWAKAKNVPIRFLELMAMGHLYQKADTGQHKTEKRLQNSYIVTAQKILDIVSEAFTFITLTRELHSTTHYYMLEGGYRFGIIGNLSLPFCNDCDRLRLDSRGNVFGCLSVAHGIQLPDAKENVSDVLKTAMAMKQEKRFSGSTLVMREIGG